MRSTARGSLPIWTIRGRVWTIRGRAPLDAYTEVLRKLFSGKIASGYSLHIYLSYVTIG